ncbi:MAG: glycoside hydrolase [Oscillochloris sp.]|nr:glycoside hydrolase [Oscillochloris sp.]
MYYQTLSEGWQIRPLATFTQGIYPRDEDGWLPAIVPGHWQQIPALATHTGKTVYRCRFGFEQPPATAQSRYWLRVNGAFYYSQAYLNGVDLGPREGYFAAYEHEIGGLLQADNTLLIEIDCPEERDKRGKRMITGVFSHWDCIDPQANPGGLWLPVELHQSGPARLSYARCLTVTCDERFAQIRFDLEIHAAQAATATLRFTFTPRTCAGETQIITQRRMLRAGKQEVGGLLKLHEPRLWWTHDLGRPDMYDVTVEVLLGDMVSDAQHFGFGVRRFELRGWEAHLNGVRFLVKGNNYPPGDMRIATMTRARCDEDLRLARECFMNMLRIHAHIDHPSFYEAADEAGMLLWQDFPLQWLYDQQILPEARRQVRAMTRLLGSHPSVAIWCMHNEAVLIEDTADESLAARLRTYVTGFGFSWNRDVMDTQLKEIVEADDPTRPAIRSSGEPDVPYLRKGTDGHAYFGWYRTYGTLDDAEVMQRRFPGNMSFVTEFGAQSLPNLESSRRFVPDPLTDEGITQLSTRHGFQAEIMDNWIAWRKADSLSELIELTQDYQIFINRYYIDRLRFYKYRPTGGIVPFIFVDPYPAILWSVVDYWRVPKRSYYAMRMTFSPQYAFCLFHPRTYAIGEAVELPLYVVNDAQHTAGGVRLTARLHNPSGSLIAETTRTLDLPADCLPIMVDRLRLTPTISGSYAIELELIGVLHEVRQVYEIEVG